MNYEEMSDFEINKRVAESLGMNARKKSSCVNHGEGKSGVSVGFGGCMRVFDPCNNPSDAWPIIVENAIDLRWWWLNEGECFSGKSSQCGKFYEPWSSSENPLRAAMIVYLMMQEAGE